MAQKRLIKNPYLNCKAKDPSKCPYHSNYKPLQLGTKVTDLFERIDKDFPSNKSYSFTNSLSIDRFLDENAEFDAKLTSDEKYALHKYTDEYGSRDITYVLNKPELDLSRYGKPEVIRQISLIDEALKKMPASSVARTLYRGMDRIPPNWNRLKPGATVEFKSFISTSADPAIALDFGSDESPVFFEIVTKEGAPIYSNYLEFEYLLPRDSKYKIISVEENTQCVTNQANSKQKIKNSTTFIRLQAIA